MREMYEFLSIMQEGLNVSLMIEMIMRSEAIGLALPEINQSLGFFSY